MAQYEILSYRRIEKLFPANLWLQNKMKSSAIMSSNKMYLLEQKQT
jgi:hypothetical protein